MKNQRPFFLTTDFLLSAVLCLYAASLYFANRVVVCATVLMVAVGAALVIYRIGSGKQPLLRPHPFVYCWLAVYAVRVVWLLFSNDPQNGLRWVDTGLPFILFPLLFQYLPLNERILKTVLAFFVHFTLLFCVVTLFTVAYHSITVPVGIKEWLLHPKSYPFGYRWTNYDHPSFLCIIYLMALPVSVYLRRRYRAVSMVEIVALIVAEAAVLAFTGARVGFVLFPGLLFLMLLYSWRSSAGSRQSSVGSQHLAVSSRQPAAGSQQIQYSGVSHCLLKTKNCLLSTKNCRLKIACCLLLIAGVAVIGLRGFGSQFAERFKDPPRMHLWEATMASIKEKPLLGTGTGGMDAVIGAPELSEKIGQTLSYPHNQYLGEVMHFGFIGATALFATLAYLLVLAFRRKDFLWLSLLFVLFVFMFTEMPLDSHKGINFFLFFMSLFMVSGFSFNVSGCWRQPTLSS
ncbi:MAG: O-antigen ligase family protein [Prevotellaceae bacterium]|jgi:hypothetical protein|nr:O-antigen ligase family protein [Prevotellaceae bacterium]